MAATAGRRLHSAFLEQAARRPEAPALVLGDRCWSYDEIADEARRLAAGLLEACPAPPRRVGVFACRSRTAYAGEVAALLAGAGFVPLNPNFPVARTRAMASSADLDAVIVDGGAALGQIAEVLDGLPHRPVVLMPEAAPPPATDTALRGGTVLDPAACSRLQPLRDLPQTCPEDLAYLLFTSGSTGEPKGIPITHANVVSFLDHNQQRYLFSPEDRLSQVFDPTFDLAVFDLFMAWSSGACLCPLLPQHLLAPGPFLRRAGITVWFSVPSVVTVLRQRNLLKPGSLPGLRWSLFCGEALPRESAQAWQAAAPDSILENLYGPTELTIACSVYRWRPGLSETACVHGVVPIGRPYDTLDWRVVDADLQPVPMGCDGELCVAGPQVFPGYWRDPERTAHSTLWVKGPDGERLRYHRTGDLVRRVDAERYVFLGRIDHQIKVMGHRVELGEVEATLREEPGVLEAAALGWPVAGGSYEGVVAFVSGDAIDAGALVAAMRSRLPAYMAPREIRVLDRMPLNANGKVHRAELRRLCEAERAGEHPAR